MHPVLEKVQGADFFEDAVYLHFFTEGIYYTQIEVIGDSMDIIKQIPLKVKYVLISIIIILGIYLVSLSLNKSGEFSLNANEYFHLHLNSNNKTDNYLRADTKLLDEINNLGFSQEFEITNFKTANGRKNNRILICEIKQKNDLYYSDSLLKENGWLKVIDNKFVKDDMELSIQAHSDKHIELIFSTKI